jgi:apolipoprotein D and lipocalin family protein
MRRLAAFLPIWLLLSLAGCAGTPEPLPVVDKVDLERYLGTWYEIARYPAPFQEGCAATTATYALRDDGDIRVLNRCHVGSPSGELREAEGRARVVDPESNAKLEVTFFWPFWGDYWVLALDENYRWVLVGEPRRRYLWILSRTPVMAPETYQSILDRLPELGYDPAGLIVTEQPPVTAE